MNPTIISIIAGVVTLVVTWLRARRKDAADTEATMVSTAERVVAILERRVSDLDVRLAATEQRLDVAEAQLRTERRSTAWLSVRVTWFEGYLAKLVAFIRSTGNEPPDPDSPEPTLEDQ